MAVTRGKMTGKTATNSNTNMRFRRGRNAGKLASMPRASNASGGARTSGS